MRVKFKRSLLTDPEGIKRYIRIYTLITSIRLLALGIICFADRDLMESVAFNSLNAIAPQFVWGIILTLIGAVAAVLSQLKYGLGLRISLIFSCAMMMVTAASFTVAAYNYGVAWWAIIPYLSIGIKDMLVAAYPGEISSD